MGQTSDATVGLGSGWKSIRSATIPFHVAELLLSLEDIADIATPLGFTTPRRRRHEILVV